MGGEGNFVYLYEIAMFLWEDILGLHYEPEKS
jgi:hypothetical protein